MEKAKRNNEGLVRYNREGRKPEETNLSVVLRRKKLVRSEKLWFVQIGQIRRHSRVLYIPLDPFVVSEFRLKKGDRVKYMLISLRRAPDEDESIPEVSEKSTVDEGEL